MGFFTKLWGGGDSSRKTDKEAEGEVVPEPVPPPAVGRPAPRNAKPAESVRTTPPTSAQPAGSNNGATAPKVPVPPTLGRPGNPQISIPPPIIPPLTRTAHAFRKAPQLVAPAPRTNGAAQTPPRGTVLPPVSGSVPVRNTAPVRPPVVAPPKVIIAGKPARPAPPIGTPQPPPSPSPRAARRGGFRIPNVTVAVPTDLPPTKEAAPVDVPPMRAEVAPAEVGPAEAMLAQAVLAVPAPVMAESGPTSTRAETAEAPTEIPSDDELDAAFDDVQHAGEGPSGEGEVASDARTVEELQLLFGKIAADHVGALRDFQLELTDTETSRQWAEICRPAVDTLHKAAQLLGYPELVMALRAYDDALARALDSGGSTMIAGVHRDEILAAYEVLRSVMPAAFDLSSERDRREPIIIDSLLEQTAGVTRQTIYRIYAAGVTRLKAFYQANAEELAAATGVDREVCEAILARVNAYRKRRAESAPGEDGAGDRARLVEVLRELQGLDEQFQTLDEERDRSKRRALRNERQALVREIDIVLAQLGEVDMIRELRRFPVERKIQRIERFLRQPRLT